MLRRLRTRFSSALPKSAVGATALAMPCNTAHFWYAELSADCPVPFISIVDAVTQGGPGQETSILVYKLYHDGFKALDLGSSAAQSVVLMFIVITLTVIQFRYVEKKVQY